MFTIFIVLLTGFLIFTYLFVPETQNKTFEEIANQFSPGESLEVEEMVDVDDYGKLDEAEPAVTEGETKHGDHALVTLNSDSAASLQPSPSPSSLSSSAAVPRAPQ